MNSFNYQLLIAHSAILSHPAVSVLPFAGKLGIKRGIINELSGII